MDIVRKDLRPFLLSSSSYFDKRASQRRNFFFSNRGSEKNKTNFKLSALPSAFKIIGQTRVSVPHVVLSTAIHACYLLIALGKDNVYLVVKFKTLAPPKRR